MSYLVKHTHTHTHTHTNDETIGGFLRRKSTKNNLKESEVEVSTIHEIILAENDGKS